jgi:hypothetical protein
MLVEWVNQFSLPVQILLTIGVAAVVCVAIPVVVGAVCFVLSNGGRNP